MITQIPLFSVEQRLPWRLKNYIIETIVNAQLESNRCSYSLPVQDNENQWSSHGRESLLQEFLNDLGILLRGMIYEG